MGRKIPGKKHRTVKDPYKQRQRRLDGVKLKINNPPSKNDEQFIPKSLLKIMELKAEAKKETNQKPLKKRIKKVKRLKSTLPSVAEILDKEPSVPKSAKPDSFVPNLVQKPGESAKSFLNRIHLMTQNLINEVEFEKKFGVEIKRNPETGEVIDVKHVKTKNKKSKKKKLSEKRKDKLKKKENNLRNIKDFNQFKDKVEFGEVVHRPPNLSALDKVDTKAKISIKPRYRNLLLRDIVDTDKDKFKNKMTNLEKERAEHERKFIVETYRKSKKEKKMSLKLKSAT